MIRLRRFVPLFAVLALAAASAPHAVHAQFPPDNGGGPGGGGPGGGGPGGPGDNGGPPGMGGGMGGPPSQAQQAQRMIRNLQRQVNADSATWDAMLPDIEKIIQLRQALESNGRPERGGPGGGGPGGDNGGGPPDANGGGGPGGGFGGGGGPGGDPNGGGGGGGNDQNAAADQNNVGGGDNGGTSRRRRRRANQDANNGDQQQQNDNGGNGGGNGPQDQTAQMKQDPTATDLLEKVRALRNTLRQSQDDGNGDAGLAPQVTAVRSAHTKAVDELAATRKDLATKLKSAHQEAVFIAAGILE